LGALCVPCQNYRIHIETQIDWGETMYMNNSRVLVAVVSAVLLIAMPISVRASAIVADHISASQFDLIPVMVVESIESAFNIYYVHTSHGSQIMTGISMVHDENGDYDAPYFYERSDDLGHNGDTSWVPYTRTYIESHPECNMAMFSWCGGCSDNTEEGINTYLAKMEELEDDYPSVTFIYMTGHLDGSGPSGNLYVRNNQIRDYCELNEKILFDFADIESWDPDGNYYPDEDDECYWCYDWCAVHACPTCGSCAHSHCFNCYLKGKAWWWMMARISGWNPQQDTIPEIMNTYPASNQTGVDVNTNINITFDIEMNAASIDSTTFVIHSGISGVCSGTYMYDAVTKTATFDPDTDFEIGDEVSVILTTGIESEGAVGLSKGRVFNFIVEVGRQNTGLFDSIDIIPLTNDPWDACCADIDGDGLTDIAVTCESGAVRVLTNVGAGIEWDESSYDVGVLPRFITAADFNQDDHIDLAVANQLSFSISILMNQGTGELAPAVDYAVSGYPFTLSPADMNADGFIDLVTCDITTGEVTVMINEGDGSFSELPSQYVGPETYSSDIADLDNDGDMDLVLSLAQDSVRVLMNDGDGTLGASIGYPADSQVISAVASDLDGDGYVDLATANMGHQVLSLFENDGSGTFSWHSSVNIDSDSNGTSIIAADLDGDGDPDLAGACVNLQGVWVLMNNGGLSFSHDSTYNETVWSQRITGASDFNGDGSLDLLMISSQSNCVGIMWNNRQYLCGDADASGAVDIDDAVYIIGYIFAGGPAPQPFGAGDVNCSGDVDIDDVVYLIGYIFSGGPPPCDGC